MSGSYGDSHDLESPGRTTIANKSYSQCGAHYKFSEGNATLNGGWRLFEDLRYAIQD